MSLFGRAIVAAVLLVGAPVHAAPAEASIDALRAAFFGGDLVAFERLRVELASRPAETRVSGAETLALEEELALWTDLARLVRCLPLGAVDGPTPRAAALRQLVRVERLRLEALLRDARFAATPLAELLGTPPLFTAELRDRPGAKWVRWPLERERWPGERLDPVPEASVCPAEPGARREADAKVRALHAQTRARALREAIAALLPSLGEVPGLAAARVALSYLVDAEASVGFEIPGEWRGVLDEALARGAPPHRSAGRVLLARAAERAGALDEARALYRAVLEDPARTDAEDSRARVRLVGLTEPAWADVLGVVRGARAPRPEDRSALANAEARALYALGDWAGLERFGRVWLRGRGTDAHDAMTLDLLFLLGLELTPSAAIAWMGELGPEASRTERIDRLGRVALEQGALELATALYDHLRTDASIGPGPKSPTRAADEVRWLAERARIEFQLRDPEAFAGFVEQILARATAEADRPLARFAPHREIARLCQDLVGRLSDEAETPERARFAAVLHAAALGLSNDASRWRTLLVDYLPPLRALAGRWDAKLAPKVSRPAGREPLRAVKPRRLRVLGEVVVPRLPPRLEVPDVATPAVAIDSFLVVPGRDGRLVVGAPWSARAEERRAAKRARSGR